MYYKSAYFKPGEFDCKCGCGLNNIKNELLFRLDRIRDEIKEPIIITSGLRCKEYNDRCGFSYTSSHITGLAVDIKVSDYAYRFKIVNAILNTDIKRIGITDSFVHIDIDTSKPKDLLWVY